MRLGMTGFYIYFTLYAAGAIFWQARRAAPPAEAGFVSEGLGFRWSSNQPMRLGHDGLLHVLHAVR